MLELILKIVGPILGLIFKNIDKSNKLKKEYDNNVDNFQYTPQNSLSEEQEAMDALNK